MNAERGRFQTQLSMYRFQWEPPPPSASPWTAEGTVGNRVTADPTAAPLTTGAVPWIGNLLYGRYLLHVTQSPQRSFKQDIALCILHMRRGGDHETNFKIHINK